MQPRFVKSNEMIVRDAIESVKFGIACLFILAVGVSSGVFLAMVTINVGLGG